MRSSSIHEGFDWEAIQEAMRKNEKRGKVAAGASTISQQLAKNLFLSGSRSWPRKAQEAVITWMMERTLSKRRILEIYLNVAGVGRGRLRRRGSGAPPFRRAGRGTQRGAGGLARGDPAEPAALRPRPRNARIIAGRMATISARMGAAQIP